MAFNSFTGGPNRAEFEWEFDVVSSGFQDLETSWQITEYLYGLQSPFGPRDLLPPPAFDPVQAARINVHYRPVMKKRERYEDDGLWEVAHKIPKNGPGDLANRARTLTNVAAARQVIDDTPHHPYQATSSEDDHVSSDTSNTSEAETGDEDDRVSVTSASDSSSEEDASESESSSDASASPVEAVEPVEAEEIINVKPRTTKPEIVFNKLSNSSVAAALPGFLAEIKSSNAQLAADNTNGKISNSFEIDGDSDDVHDGQYIEMSLGLGVLEEKPVESSTDSDDDASASPVRTEDVMGKLLGDHQDAKKAFIEEV